MDSSVGRSIIGKSVQQCPDLFELIVTAHIMFSSERMVTNKAAEIYEINSTSIYRCTYCYFNKASGVTCKIANTWSKLNDGQFIM